ncbi:hypothetical protein [Streptomyces sp. NBC_00212]|uniref:hypothetical protein n=1 Tax=Streptomyces sp. NBC_00212 TaxID=2975684 RepID=UPI003243BA77
MVFAPEQDGAVQVAGSDPEVHRLEHDTAGWREGPGHGCHRRHALPGLTVLDGHPARQRWPHYAPRAVSLGCSSVVALPLREHTRSIGALVLLSDGQSPLPSDMLALGQSMADFTAVVLRRAREADNSRARTSHLGRALATLIIIEQAKGIIATRFSLAPLDAFQIAFGGRLTAATGS